MSIKQNPLEKMVDIIYCQIQKVTRVMVGVLLVLMVIMVFANVVARYYLDFSLAWSEEVARFMLIWLVFLGAVLAYVEDEHLGLDMMVSKLPEKSRQLLAVVTDIMVLYAIWLITQGGYMMTVDSWDWEAVSVPIAFGWVYLVIPVSGGLMFFQGLLKMYYHIKGIFNAPGVKSC